MIDLEVTLEHVDLREEPVTVGTLHARRQQLHRLTLGGEQAHENVALVLGKVAAGGLALGAD